ncbi:hypothetical protein HN592_01660 [Candidatus Woesearchaeota archaeon]|jgi:hypothetical protein|nr:hypothetical protein [Candidatus Woesearchaeota archaeon]MBT4368611.1 hypothetical protein [Candidatus Woesearchaeota archaeon]MBT4713080.1 hypothetical protein [Candidatus Woesearchaeota archaeon]MBT6639002.1 hypothetical protein [Candidatus Woesearchaeota archaeon]MBT7134201.1 hypothetical protein [Candidatus Woesearchaeota archaeon]
MVKKRGVKKRGSTKKSSVKSRSKKAPKRSKKQKIILDIGKGGFVFGIILAIVVGILLGTSNVKLGLGVGITYSIIFLLGLIVGILNITVDEINEFLIAAITFLVAAGVNVFVIKMTLPLFGGVIEQISVAIGVFVAPAATIVAIKAMYELAKKK